MLNHDVLHGPLKHCQICGSEQLESVIDLGHQPLCDSLLSEQQLEESEETFPLRLNRCTECTLTQLDYVVPGNKVYHRTYPYRSGVTNELVIYQTAMSDNLISRHKLYKNCFVVDIGSNDGTLLSGFKKQGMRVLGVEPTDIAKYAQSNNIDTIQDFFTENIANNIIETYGHARLVTGTNVFAHMAELGETIRGMSVLIGDDGIIVIEIHYLLDIIKRLQFDTIYHEHIRTYSLKSLVTLFEQYELEVFDAQRVSRYGGNLRIHVAKKHRYPLEKSVSNLLSAEQDFGLDTSEVYTKFRNDVIDLKNRTMEFAYGCARQGLQLVGNSCPGRASTLINYYGLDRTLIPYLAEQPASLKKGLYLPGKHIPVVDNSILAKEQPDYILLLAWHYAEPIIEYLRDRGVKSTLVKPLPDLEFIKQ